MTVDVLAVGAHPDDADLGVGGTLLKLAARGLRTAILDLTRGELSSRGTTEERVKEGAEAARILGLAGRPQAGLPDGGIENSRSQREVVIRTLRVLCPKVLIAPMAPDRHPDHAAAHALVRDANYFSGVAGLDTGQEPYRVPQVFYYHPYQGVDESPRYVVDISDHFEGKRAALRAYASQFHNPDYRGRETWIASEAFWESIETRARYWGGRVGVRYGEPLHVDGPVLLDMAALFGR